MHPRTILLAEPDTQLRAAWRAGLMAMDFQVLESGDGSTALATALRREVTLLITELYLPGTRERCLVRAARREAGLRRVKILVVSTHGAVEDRNWALAAGADGYLVKPVPISQMLQVASRLATSRTPSRAEARSGARHEA